ncbi:hypothetical protein Tco_0608833 [Tanacetum coccineum]
MNFLDSLKSWNDRFFWVDAFACPASFLWNSSKSVSKDPFPKSSQYNVEHYATLVAYSAPFQMDLLSFIRTAEPIKVRVGERQRAEGEPKLLDTNVGHVVSLLPVAPAHASSELEAIVDKLFDEGGSGGQTKQGDSVSGRHGVGIFPFSETAEIIAKDAALVQPKRQRKRKTIVSDAGEPSHPPKKLREDYETSTGPYVAGKSRSTLQRLLAGAVLNPKVGIEALPTLPFITSYVSVTAEIESEDQTNSMAGANLRTITAPLRFVISSDSSHHSGANIAEAEVDSFARPSVLLMTVATTVTSTVDPATTVKEKFVESFVFGGDSSGGRADHTVGGFSDLTGSDFIVGGIRTVISPDVDLQKRRRLNFVVEEKGSLLKARDAEIEGLKAQLLVKEAEAAKAICLRAEASKFEAIEKSLQDEVRVLKDCNTTLEKEKSELNVKVVDLAASMKVREQEAADLDAMREKFQDEKMAEVNEKFDKLCADFVEMALHLEEKFYPHLLTTISGRRWLLTHGMELAIAKCLNSTEYLSVLGAAIGKAIEKGIQEGLSAGITHGAEGRKLTDVAAYNPSAKADYLSALQRLQSVNFSLIGELKSNKDSSVDTIMNHLRLEDTLAERLGLTESQPYVNQLMVPIHHSPDQRIIGASALSLSLDFSNSRVQKIRENIASHISPLRGVFVPLSEPLSAAALEVRQYSDDYEVAHADGQESAGADGQAVVDENVNPFPILWPLNIRNDSSLFICCSAKSPGGVTKTFAMGFNIMICLFQ